jgi:hypothetical protein
MFLRPLPVSSVLVLTQRNSRSVRWVRQSGAAHEGAPNLRKRCVTPDCAFLS